MPIFDQEVKFCGKAILLNRATILKYTIVVIGGIVVIVTAVGLKVRGLKPGRGIFKGY
jgi:hypothetical protein